MCKSNRHYKVPVTIQGPYVSKYSRSTRDKEYLKCQSPPTSVHWSMSGRIIHVLRRGDVSKRRNYTSRIDHDDDDADDEDRHEYITDASPRDKISEVHIIE